MAIVYGINAALEALKAEESEIERVCVQRDQRNPRIQIIVDLARRRGTPLSFEEKSWLDRKSQDARHQGVMVYLGEIATFSPEQILEQAGKPGLVLVLDGIEDPHNLGALLRSAEVSGVDGVFVPQRRSAGLSASVVKSSAGAASHVRVARIGNTAQLLRTLKDSSYWIAGLDPASSLAPWDVDFKLPTALVIGSEGAGLHRLVKENCDFLVGIPVRGKVSSHNASVAAGIVLYEILRQRNSA